MKPLIKYCNTALNAVFLLTNIIKLIDSSQISPVYGYFEKIGIPEAERIRKIEKEKEVQSLFRISGGEEAELGQAVYQAGLLVSILELENATGVCGGSLISSDRVLTAGHCWYDGVHQGYSITVVLGSLTIFTGGTRINTSLVKIHPKWDPALVRNDMAVVYLPQEVKFTDNISPIALPYGRDLCQTFVGYTAFATGFGRTSDNTSIPQPYSLNHLNLTVISNDDCKETYNGVIQHTNICTVGPDRSNVCSGDSGGPLVTMGKEGKSILIGVVSFGSARGCESNLPAGFSRVTSYLFFIHHHLYSKWSE